MPRGNAPSGAAAQLTLRVAARPDTDPRGEGSTYTVKGQDTGHHLQCQVTATDAGGSATAKSAFVTIPVGARARLRGRDVGGQSCPQGREVSVPVTCSSHASGGCQIALRVTRRRDAQRGRVVASRRARHAAPTRAPRRCASDGDARKRAHASGARARTERSPPRSTRPAGACSLRGERLPRDLVGQRDGDRGDRIAARPAARRARGVRSRRIDPCRAPPLAARRTAGLLAVVLALSSSQPAARASASSPVRARRRSTTSALLRRRPTWAGTPTSRSAGATARRRVLEQASELLSLGLRARGLPLRVARRRLVARHTRRRRARSRSAPRSGRTGWRGWRARCTRRGCAWGSTRTPGSDGCGGAGQGSYGHYQQDANTFAAWGFDAVKVDFCGGAEDAPRTRGGLLANSTPRSKPTRATARCCCPSATSCSRASTPKASPRWPNRRSPPTPSARASATAGAPTPTWASPGNVPLHQRAAQHRRRRRATRRRRDPGTGTTPTTSAPTRACPPPSSAPSVSMWAMLAAPLMVSDDLTQIIRREPRGRVQTAEVIAIDQDPAGVQGTLVASTGRRAGVGQAAERRLARGRAAQPRLDSPCQSKRARSPPACPRPDATRCAISGRTRRARRPARSPPRCPAARPCCCASRAPMRPRPPAPGNL